MASLLLADRTMVYFILLSSGEGLALFSVKASNDIVGRGQVAIHDHRHLAGCAHHHDERRLGPGRAARRARADRG